VKIIIRPIKAKTLEAKAAAAWRYYLHSHQAGGGSLRSTGQGSFAIEGEYVGTAQAAEHRAAVFLEWAKVLNGPFFQIKN
jgi:hypothetical protein